MSSPDGSLAPLRTESISLMPISADSGVDQGCPLSTCGFSAATDPILRSLMADICIHHDTGAKLFAYLDDWYVWIKLQHLLQIICSNHSSQPDQSILNCRPSKVQNSKASCQDPIFAKLQDKVRLRCLGGHLQIHSDIEPSLVVLASRPPWKKQHIRFQRIATTLADLNAEGLDAQTVNDLLTMYVGAASQHVLRMSFVPEQEAHKLRKAGHDILVPSNSTRRHLSTILLTPQTWGTWSGLSSPATRSSPMARLAIDHFHINGNNPITGHRHSFQRCTTTRSPTCTTSNNTLTTDEQASLPP